MRLNNINLAAKRIHIPLTNFNRLANRISSPSPMLPCSIVRHLQSVSILSRSSFIASGVNVISALRHTKLLVPCKATILIIFRHQSDYLRLRCRRSIVEMQLLTALVLILLMAAIEQEASYVVCSISQTCISTCCECRL